jgi:hypothetical protein
MKKNVNERKKSDNESKNKKNPPRGIATSIDMVDSIISSNYKIDY